MGEYRCPLSEKIKPASHDEWHGDMFSSVCPVLRDTLEVAVADENWKRVKKLMKLLEKHFPSALN